MSTTTTAPARPRPAAADDTDGCRRRPAAPPVRKGEQGKLLRIGVKTKAARYVLRYVAGPSTRPRRRGRKDKDLTVLVDRKASLFLIGTVMDYEVKTLTAGFTFTNPNEKGRCGCGESFHV